MVCVWTLPAPLVSSGMLKKDPACGDIQGGGGANRIVSVVGVGIQWPSDIRRETAVSAALGISEVDGVPDTGFGSWRVHIRQGGINGGFRAGNGEYELRTVGGGAFHCPARS